MSPERDSDHRFGMQDALYCFPYRYIPQSAADGDVSLHRGWGWGLEYLTFMTYVARIVREANPGSLLDVGAGDGRLIHMLRGSIARRAGVDLSTEALRWARAFNPDAEWYCGPVSEVPGRYDVVTCIETMEHVPDDELPSFIAGIKSRLRTGGTLVVSVPASTRPVIEKHYRHYSIDLLRRQLGSDFEIKTSAWLFKVGACSSTLQMLFSNRLFALQLPTLRRAIWRFHLKHSYYADERTERILSCKRWPGDASGERWGTSNRSAHRAFRRGSRRRCRSTSRGAMRVLLNAYGGTHGESATARYVRNLIRWLPRLAPDTDFTAFEFLSRRPPFTRALGRSNSLRTIYWPLPPRIGEAAFRRFSWWVSAVPFGSSTWRT